MELFVKTLSGQTYTLDVEASTLVDDIKGQVAGLQGKTSSANLRLIFSGKQLENDRALRDYNILGGSTLYVS
jgi:ubiquitin C